MDDTELYLRDGSQPATLPDIGVPFAPAPPWTGTPGLAGTYARAVNLRNIAYQALVKALIGQKQYEVDGLSIGRYDIKKLQDAYIWWDNYVNSILQNGNTATMQYKRIIPLDII